MSFIGPVKTAFRGRARFKSDESAFRMIFAFERIEVEAFGRTLLRKERAEAKEKTYTFFLIQEDMAAANSSGTGGKALLYRGT